MAQIQVDVGEIVGKGYGAFWNSKHRYRVVKGGKGSKKSTTAALWYIIKMMQYPTANLLVIRKVYNTHRNSTFGQLKWAINRLKVNQYWKAIESPFQITYKPTGQKILFAGFDDWQKIASTKLETGDLCWVWIEEAFEITSEDEFINLDLSVPRGEVSKGLFKQTTFTFNPWSEKHWLKKRFFDKQDPNVFTLTTNYMCNEHLDEVDIANYEDMKIRNPRKYQIAGLGNWGISEGLVYEDWEESSFDIKDILNGKDAWKLRIARGLDFGYNDPTAYVEMAVNPVDKILYVYDEHYESKMLCNNIHAMLAEKGVTKDRIIADCQAKQMIEELRMLGISRITSSRKGKDSIMKGIDLLQQYHIIIHSKCQNVITEISSYIFDKKEDAIINKPVDKNNHLMDAMRYAMEDVIYFKPEVRKKLKETYKERMREVRKSGGGAIRASDFTGGWS